MDAAVAAVGLLVGGRNDAALGGHVFGALPHLRQLDAVDPIAPRPPPGEGWLCADVVLLERVQLPACAFTHGPQTRFHCGVHLVEKHAAEVASEHAIRLVLVAQLGGDCTAFGVMARGREQGWQ